MRSWTTCTATRFSEAIPLVAGPPHVGTLIVGGGCCCWRVVVGVRTVRRTGWRFEWAVPLSLQPLGCRPGHTLPPPLTHCRVQAGVPPVPAAAPCLAAAMDWCSPSSRRPRAQFAQGCSGVYVNARHRVPCAARRNRDFCAHVFFPIRSSLCVRFAKKHQPVFHNPDLR